MKNEDDIDRRFNDKIKYFDDIDKIIMESKNSMLNINPQSKNKIPENKITDNISSLNNNFPHNQTQSIENQSIPLSKDNLSLNNNELLTKVSQETTNNNISKNLSKIKINSQNQESNKGNLNKSSNKKKQNFQLKNNFNSKIKSNLDDSKNVFIKLYDDGVNKRQEYEKELENFNKSLLFAHHPEITDLAKNIELNPKCPDERLYPKAKITEKQRIFRKKRSRSLNMSFLSQSSTKSVRSSSLLATTHAQKMSMSLSKREFYKKFKADSKTKSSIEETFHPFLSQNSLIMARKKGSSFERLTTKIKPSNKNTSIVLNSVSTINNKKLLKKKSVDLGNKLHEMAKTYEIKKKEEILKKQLQDENEFSKFAFSPNLSIANFSNSMKKPENAKISMYDRQNIWQKTKFARLDKFKNHLIEKEEESYNHYRPKLNPLEICDDEEFIRKNLKQIFSYVERKQKAKTIQKEREKSIEKRFGYGKNYIPYNTKFDEFKFHHKKDRNDLVDGKNPFLEDLRKSRHSYKTNKFFSNEKIKEENSLFDDFDYFHKKESFISKMKNSSNFETNNRSSNPESQKIKENENIIKSKLKTSSEYKNDNEIVVKSTIENSDQIFEKTKIKTKRKTSFDLKKDIVKIIEKNDKKFENSISNSHIIPLVENSIYTKKNLKPSKSKLIYTNNKHKNESIYVSPPKNCFCKKSQKKQENFDNKKIKNDGKN